MIFRVFTLFDSKALYYLEPFFELSEQDAVDFVRGVMFCHFDGIANPFYKRSDDYILTELGTFDDSDARFYGFAKPRFLSAISDYLVVN